MEIQENWTAIVGRVVTVEPSSKYHDHMSLEVTLVSADGVDGFANFVKAQAGDRLSLLVERRLPVLRDIQPGRVVKARIRMARPGIYFVHRDHVSVSD